MSDRKEKRIKQETPPSSDREEKRIKQETLPSSSDVPPCNSGSGSCSCPRPAFADDTRMFDIRGYIVGPPGSGGEPGKRKIERVGPPDIDFTYLACRCGRIATVACYNKGLMYSFPLDVSIRNLVRTIFINGVIYRTFPCLRCGRMFYYKCPPNTKGLTF